MTPCPNIAAASKGRAYTVVNTNGIHKININCCHCVDATDDAFQLTSAGLFPATIEKPETVFTFAALKDFHAHTLASKKSAYDHFAALRKLTNNAFPDQTPVSNLFTHENQILYLNYITGSLSRISPSCTSVEIPHFCTPSRTGAQH
jgi:hypothetical protein